MHLASGISTLLYFLKNSGQPATDRDAWSRPNTFQYEVLNFNSSDNHLVLARFEFYLSISQVSQIKTQLKHKRRDSSCNSAEIGTLSLSHNPIRKCAIQKTLLFMHLCKIMFRSLIQYVDRVEKMIYMRSTSISIISSFQFFDYNVRNK